MVAEAFTPLEVRVKLDRLIAHTERRIDMIETAMRESPSPTLAVLDTATLEHQYGRLHGLQEAAELMDLLPEPVGKADPYAGRTAATDLAEDR